MKQVSQEAIQRLVKAWNDPGPHPGFHRRAKDELQREWPSLHAAVQAIADESDRA